MSATTAVVVASSRDVLSHHARSFRWAAAFLPASCHDDAAVLYAAIRTVAPHIKEPHRERARTALRSDLPEAAE